MKKIVCFSGGHSSALAAIETARKYGTEGMILLNDMGYKAVFPLADWERTIWETQEVEIARPSTYTTYKHANCIGCLKAGKQHWYCVYCL